MALTRKALKAMGLTDEQVDSIVEMHTDTVDGLKEKIRIAEEKAADYDEVKKQLEASKGGKDYKSEYDKLKGEFDKYKKDITEKEVAAAKTKAGRAYFESKGIKGGNLEIAMRGAKDEISALELDGDKIKDTKALDALIAGDYKGLIVSESTKGADPVNPPAGGGSVFKTKAEIYAKDDKGRYKMDAIQRQQELAKLEASRKE